MPKAAKKRTANKAAKLKLPPQSDWRTSDEDEVNRRRQRALDELFRIKPDPENTHPVFGHFNITSKSGQSYRVQLRNLTPLLQSCQCADFLTNGLGTCKDSIPQSGDNPTPQLLTEIESTLTAFQGA